MRIIQKPDDFKYDIKNMRLCKTNGYLLQEIFTGSYNFFPKEYWALVWVMVNEIDAQELDFIVKKDIGCQSIITTTIILCTPGELANNEAIGMFCSISGDHQIVKLLEES